MAYCPSLLTLLVVPLSLHLLDDVEVKHWVSPAQAAAQGRQKVADHLLVLALAGTGQAGEILQDQLLPVLREALTISPVITRVAGSGEL